MRKVIAAAFAVCAVAWAVSLPAQAETTGNTTAGEYIVVLKDGVDSNLTAQKHNRDLGAQLNHVYSAALKGYSARLTDLARSQVASDPAVAWVEPVKEVHAAGQTLPTGVDRADADLSKTARIDGVDDRVNVDVAVIDTGVNISHPDLNVVPGKNCTLPILPPEDGNGHGTHVSGTIGALDNNEGVVGMAPGARIWPVKVLNDAGIGTSADVVCGIDFVAANADKIKVANMSLGGSGSDDGKCGTTNGDAEHQAICRAVSAGVTFAVAAGNDHADAKDSIPASYDEVITVSALADFNGQPGGGAPSTCRADEDDTFANFSNYGPDVDIIAPGVCILSTWKDGGYNTISGTSMATPHVTGAAALYAATHPGATPDQVKTALQQAGTLNWIWPSQDPDGIQEKLLNVSSF